MNSPVKLDDLRDAYEWVSAGDAAAIECKAFVSRVNGSVHWSGDGVDEELPDDIEDGSLYLAVPHKSELDLGRSLALRFAEHRMPALYDAVHECFGRRGAYGRFKSLLEDAGQLEAWREYEEAAIDNALAEWCEENGIELAR